jgi:hypothetical protein
MQQTLWGKTIPQRRQKRKVKPLSLAPPYSITGANDCAIICHTLREWDLAGCTICLDCGVNIYCPHCITIHPHVATGIALLCSKHEESMVQP